MQSSRGALGQEVVHSIPTEDRDLERKPVPTVCVEFSLGSNAQHGFSFINTVG